jgi:hypothetical protein
MMISFATKADLLAAKFELQSEIQAVKHEILKWVIGMAVAQRGHVGRCPTLLPHAPSGLDDLGDVTTKSAPKGQPWH